MTSQNISNYIPDDFENLSFEQLETVKKKLKSTKYNLIKETKKVSTSIDTIERTIVRKCGNRDGGHQWTKYREDCMYGETYCYCKYCGVDYYSRCVIYNIDDFS